MANLNSPEGELTDIFVTDYGMIDRFAATGTLWTWGDNSQGQLGINSVTPTSSPVQTVAGGTTWGQVSAAQVGYVVATIKTDGTLWSWGRNAQGQIGDGTSVNKSSPVQTISGGNNWLQVSAGNCTTAIKTDGSLWGWGSNAYGQLGDSTIVDKSSPVQTISRGNNWVQVTSNFGQSPAGIKSDGTLWTWGRNIEGELGDGTTNNRSSPAQTIAGGTNWSQVSDGQFLKGAIKTDGTLWVWGFNTNGQLGDGTFISKSSPVQTISGGTNWKQVSAGTGNFGAIKTDGTLWTWGTNNYGQLGDGTSVGKSSPVQTISGGTNWKLVCAGSYTTSAIKIDGTLWMWGWNANGALGDGTITNKSSPVQTIARGSNWKLVASGYNYVSGIYFNNATGNFPSAGT